MDIRIVKAIDEIDAHEWNDLITDNNPFCKHEVLSALEKHEKNITTQHLACRHSFC
ncbi:hypothetical protein MNB_SUP05-13-293 [hydrothermal vent metagenome]|uniref:Uncharacterized protein n=1 Tax=hydrothermal vent metagenome TaxID=652676 RepID=A0A1W1DG36_9ZZZZ